MKRFRYVFFVLLYVVFSCVLLNNLSTQTANANDEIYAKVTSNLCCLYYSPISSSDVIVSIEPTYFVKILPSVTNDDQNSKYYRAEYNGVKGYVKKEDIALTSDTPQNAFPTQSLKINSLTNLYQKPHSTSFIYTSIAPNTILQTVGVVSGEEIEQNRSNLWYLVKYTQSDKTIYGYVYNRFVSNVEQIEPNTENYQTISISANENTSILNIPANSFNLILIMLLLPSIVLVVALFRPKQNIN